MLCIVNLIRRYLLSEIKTKSVILVSLETNIIELKEETFAKYLRVLKIPQDVKGTYKLNSYCPENKKFKLVTSADFLPMKTRVPCAVLKPKQYLNMTVKVIEEKAGTDNAFAAISRFYIKDGKGYVVPIPEIDAKAAIEEAKKLAIADIKSGRSDFSAPINALAQFINAKGGTAFARYEHQLYRKYWIDCPNANDYKKDLISAIEKEKITII